MSLYTKRIYFSEFSDYKGKLSNYLNSGSYVEVSLESLEPYNDSTEATFKVIVHPIFTDLSLIQETTRKISGSIVWGQANNAATFNKGYQYSSNGTDVLITTKTIVFSSSPDSNIFRNVMVNISLTDQTGAGSYSQICRYSANGITMYSSGIGYIPAGATIYFGNSATINFNKTSSYKLTVCKYSNNTYQDLYSVTATNSKSITVNVPKSAYDALDTNHTTNYYKLEEDINGDGEYETRFIGRNISVVDFPASITLSAAQRVPTETDENAVSLTISGATSYIADSRTVNIYVKDSGSDTFTKLDAESFSVDRTFDVTKNIDLSADKSYRIYCAIDDGHSIAKSLILEIYSEFHIMDIRSDGTGVAFGGTAENENEFYIGFKRLRTIDLKVEGEFYPNNHSVTIPASGWSSSKPYTNTVTVNGITASDNVEIIPVGDSVQYNYLSYNSAGTADGSITFKANYTKPTVDLPVIIRRV